MSMRHVNVRQGHRRERRNFLTNGGQMAYEMKPNTGKAWETSKEDKQKNHERLMGQEWYASKTTEEKRELIDKWTGNIKVQTDSGVKDMKIALQEGTSLKGRPQMSIRLWEAKPRPDSDGSGDSDGDIPF
jgi:hypothetical protein